MTVLQVLWIPEYFKARGAHSASLYAETFAVAAANLPGVFNSPVGCQAWWLFLTRQPCCCLGCLPGSMWKSN